MSTTVDNRIVEMQFDNREFETNAKASINTLEKLKDELDMSKAARGFDELDGAAKQVNLNPLITAAQSVGEKFSAMDVAAITAISRITNAAIDAGKKLVSSLSIDNITSGWAKYGEKTKSTATIIAATAKDIGEGEKYLYHSEEEQMAAVTEWLDKLALFSDETSYSLTDMTSNIAKFTSMNIDLETSVKAMEGIATWAALSGSGVAQASRAMYNLSQALGMGSVRVQDWMSIENAGMATYEFKNMVIAEAIAQKKLTEDGKTFGKNTEKTVKIINELTGELEIVKQTTEATAVTAENFRSTLAEGWFDNEVLTAVLEKYGAFSTKLLDYVDGSDRTANQWLEAIEKFNSGDEKFDIAEFASHVKLFNEETGEMDTATAEQMAEILKDLGSETYELGRKAFVAAQEAKTLEEAFDATKDAVSSKWMKIFELAFGDYKQAKKLWTWLSNELYEIFAEPLNEVIEIFQIWHDEEDGGFVDFWEAILSIWNSIKDVIGAVKKGFAEIFPPKTADGLINATKNFKAFAERLKPSKALLEQITKGAKVVAKAINGLSLVFKMAGKIIGAVFDGIKKVFFRANPLSEFADEAEAAADVINGPIFKLLDKFGNKMQELYNKLDNGTLLEDITNGVVNFAENIKAAFKTIKDTLEKWGVFDFLKKAKEDIVGFFSSGSEIDASGEEITEEMLSAMSPLERFGLRAKSVFAKIKGFFESDKPLEAIKTFFGKIGEFFANEGTKIKDIITNVLNGIGGFFSPVLTFVNTVVNTVFPTLTLAVEKMGELVTYIINNLSIKNIVTAISIVAAFKLLISLFQAIDGIGDMVSGIGDSFYQLSKTIKAAKKAVNRASFSALISAIGKAILEIAAAMAIVSLIPKEKMLQAIAIVTGSFAAILGAILLVSKLSKNQEIEGFTGKTVWQIAAMTIAMGGAVALIANAIRKLGNIDSDSFAQGLYGAAAILGLSAIFVSLPMMLAKDNNFIKKIIKGDKIKDISNVTTSNGADFKGIAIALLSLTVAVSKMAKVVNTLGSLNPDVFAQGLYGMVAVIGVVGGIMAALIILANHSKANDKTAKSTAKDIKSIAKSFLSLSIGLSLLSLAMTNMANNVTDTTTLWHAAGVIATLGIVMTIMIGTLSKITEGKGFIKVGLGLLLVAGALSLLAKPLEALANSEAETGWLLEATLALGALLVVITAMGAVLSKLAVGGLGVMGVGAGLILIAAAIKLMVPPMEALSKIDAAPLWKAWGVLSAMLVVITLMAGVLSIFTTSGLGVMGVGAGLAIMAVALNMLVPPIEALAAIDAASLWKAWGALSAMLLVIAAFGALTLGGSTLLVTGAGLIIVANALNLVADAMIAIEGIDTTSTWSMVGALAVASLLGAPMLLLGVALAALGSSLVVLGGGATVAGEGMQILADGLQALVDFIFGMAERIGNIIQDVWNAIITSFKNFFGIHSPSTVMEEEGGFLIAGLVNGLKNFDAIQAIKGAVQFVGGKIKGFFEGMGETFRNVGKGISGLVGKGIEAAKGVAENVKKFGQNISQGLSNGIDNKNNVVVEAVSKVANGAVGLFKKIFKINSPSKVMEEMGEYLDDGLAKGITDNASTSNNAITNLGSGLMDKLSSVFNLENFDISKLTDFISGNLTLGDTSSLISSVTSLGDNLGEGLSDNMLSSLSDSFMGQFDSMLDGFDAENLTVTPVMDLSEIEAGFGDIDNMASGYNLSLGSNLDYSKYADSLQNGSPDNSNVVAAINTLRDEVSSISQMVGKMQVVMDTGALVGQLTVPMDQALGKQLVYGSRGM